jgi:hypothetical protein
MAAVPKSGNIWDNNTPSLIDSYPMPGSPHPARPANPYPGIVRCRQGKKNRVRPREIPIVRTR